MSAIIEKRYESYNGATVECAHYTIDTNNPIFRFNGVFGTGSEMDGDYAWQMVAKANHACTITVKIGNRSFDFGILTEFDKLTHIFENVRVASYPYAEIIFPTGQFWLYHTQLEHGNTVTDWHPNSDDSYERAAALVESTAASFKIEQDSIMSTVEKIVSTEDLAYIESHGYSTLKQYADGIRTEVMNTITGDGSAESGYVTRSEFEQTASGFSLVAETQTNGNKLVSVINQASDKISMSALNINLDGYVTFTNLATAGATTINGGNIITGTFSADKIVSGTLGSNVIYAGLIDADNITAGTISADVTATNLTMAGGRINIATTTESSDLIHLGAEYRHPDEVYTIGSYRYTYGYNFNTYVEVTPVSYRVDSKKTTSRSQVHVDGGSSELHSTTYDHYTSYMLMDGFTSRYAPSNSNWYEQTFYSGHFGYDGIWLTNANTAVFKIDPRSYTQENGVNVTAGISTTLPTTFSGDVILPGFNSVYFGSKSNENSFLNRVIPTFRSWYITSPIKNAFITNNAIVTDYTSGGVTIPSYVNFYTYGRICYVNFYLYVSDVSNVSSSMISFNVTIDVHSANSQYQQLPVPTETIINAERQSESSAITYTYNTKYAGVLSFGNSDGASGYVIIDRIEARDSSNNILRDSNNNIIYDVRFSFRLQKSSGFLSGTVSYPIED